MDRNILKIVQQFLAWSFCLGCTLVKQEEEDNNNKMEKWAYFTISQKSRNSMPSLLIIGGASKQHKRMPKKVFHHNNYRSIRLLLRHGLCTFYQGFPEFLVDPYYDPLAWFMICKNIERSIKCLPLQQFITMLQNTEVISISQYFIILLFQVVT